MSDLDITRDHHSFLSPRSKKYQIPLDRPGGYRLYGPPGRPVAICCTRRSCDTKTGKAQVWRSPDGDAWAWPCDVIEQARALNIGVRVLDPAAGVVWEADPGMFDAFGADVPWKGAGPQKFLLLSVWEKRPWRRSRRAA